MTELSMAAGFLENGLRALLFFAIYVLAGLLPLCAVLYLIYFMLTLPLRRRERARLFLDALESGLKQGITPEAAIARVASARDLSFGARFYAVAEQVANGNRLSEALRKVPRFVPKEIASMLRVGERIGNLAAVIPACRHVLQDAVSQVRGGLNYLVLLLFGATPALLFVPLFLRARVLPRYQEIYRDMSPSPLPALTRFVFTEQSLFLFVEIAMLLFLLAALLAYVGGPRLAAWVNHIAPGSVDRLAYRLPWRRKRLQRDFSSMLALLLDSRVPEPEAVQLAAEAVNNLVIQMRAQRVREALEKGTKLMEAISSMDEEGEFRWRLRNAAHGPGGFVRALAGWHDALHAKAFQLEQSAAQVATTVLVLINGVIVGTVVVAVFLALIELTNQAALW